MGGREGQEEDGGREAVGERKTIMLQKYLFPHTPNTILPLLTEV